MTQSSESMHKQSFLASLAVQNDLATSAISLLHASGARTPEAVLSVLQSFPSAAQRAGISSPKLSNQVMQQGGVNLQTMMMDAMGGHTIAELRRADQAASYGALAPPMAKWQESRSVPWPPAPPAPSIASSEGAGPTLLSHGDNVDTRGCLPWPVRDQGQRGTCVAFGTTALREQLACEKGGFTDYSEQFLYWDIKTNSLDPFKTKDGTWIEFAFQSLNQSGICEETLWRYNPVFDRTNISQDSNGVPSAATIAAARNASYKAAAYQRTSQPAGVAQTILSLLRQQGRPVAISVPVFSDPTVPNSDNWATPVGWGYGFVLDPPPTSVVSGGHCVCVTGFSPDETEPLGGYFIIRNSWSTQWGSQLPAAGYHGPEAGYGQISASYVDQYLWEFGQL